MDPGKWNGPAVAFCTSVRGGPDARGAGSPSQRRSESLLFRFVRPLALALTVLTGFSGLVYEVTWQKYLATLVGSHAEAAAAVLGIFLAGLSIGYGFFGTWSAARVARSEAGGRPARLLAVEGRLRQPGAVEQRPECE